MSDLPQELRDEADLLEAQYEYRREFGEYPTTEELKEYIDRNRKENVLSVEKTQIYVDSPESAPEGREVQQGPEGGYYYETESDSDDENEELVDQDESDDGASVEQLRGEIGGDAFDELMESGWSLKDIEIGVGEDDFEAKDLVLYENDEGEVRMSFVDKILGGSVKVSDEFDPLDEDQIVGRIEDRDPSDVQSVNDVEEYVNLYKNDLTGRIDRSGFSEKITRDLLRESDAPGGNVFRGIVNAAETNSERSISKDMLGGLAEDVEITVDGFDESFSFDPWKEKQKFEQIARDRLSQEYDRETVDSVVFEMQEQISAWSSSSTDEDALPLWAIADEIGIDGEVPYDVPDNIETGFSGEEMEIVEGFVDIQRELIEEIYGEEITVYRGMGGSVLRDRRETGVYESEMYHRKIASWSVAAPAAQNFAYSGGVFKNKIPTENLLITYLGGAGLHDEYEVVGSPERFKQTYTEKESFGDDDQELILDKDYEGAFDEFYERMRDFV